MTSTGHDDDRESPDVTTPLTLPDSESEEEEDPDVCEAMAEVEAAQEVAADEEQVDSSHTGVTRSDIEDVQGKRADTRSRTSQQREDTMICLFCRQKTRRVKNNRRQHLTQVLTFEACEAINCAAEIRGDERMLMEFAPVPGRPDPIARELHYHRICYAEFTHRKKLDDLLEREENEEKSSVHAAAYTKAFDLLADEVQRSILDQADFGKTVRMTDLCSFYNRLLNEQGIDTTRHRTQKLKHRLKDRFGNALVFFRNEKRITDPLLVTASDVPREVLFSGAAGSLSLGSFSAEHDTGESLGDESFTSDQSTDHPTLLSDILGTESSAAALDDVARIELVHSAMFLRGLIMNMKNTLPPTPTAEDLLQESPGAGVIPPPLYNFLSWILCGVSVSVDSLDQPVTVPEMVTQRHVISVAQDIIHCTRKGQIRTPKHFALPLTVKHLTRSEQLVSLLNKFGHGYSASRILEYETAMAERCVGQIGKNGEFVPSNIDPMQPAIYCWDNIDFREETPSGAGTTHCTNGIIIQRSIANTSQPQPTLQAEPDSSATKSKKRHQRALNPPVAPELQYVAGARPEPPGQHSYHVNVGDSQYLEKAQSSDRTWLILRMCKTDSAKLGRCEELQTVLPWSGFNAAIGSVPRQSEIGYLPVIPQSPTEFATVYELLKRSCATSKQLNQPHTIITVDQAIYCKAQEIRWKNMEEFKSVVLRMGSFHIACTFLAVLGKRFADAGLRDLLVESGVIASGSVAAVLDGKHYNRGIRAHKIVWEAMSRLRWRQFESFLTNDGAGCPVDFEKLTAELQNARTENSKETFLAVRDSPEMKSLLAAYAGFIEED